MAENADNEEGRRNLRFQYLNLIDTTIASKKNLVKPGSKELLVKFEEGNKLFTSVVHAREGTLDAIWFRTASQFGIELINNIDNKDFTARDIFKALVSKYVPVGTISNAASDMAAKGKQRKDTGKGKKRAQHESDNESASGSEADDDDDETVATEAMDEQRIRDAFDWRAFGRDVAPLMRRTPTVTFMYGPIKVEVKKKEKAKRQKQKQQVAATHLQEVAEGNEDNETAKRVRAVQKRLKRMETAKKAKTNDQTTDDEPDKPNVFELLVDPNSFTRTIENLFYFSFLIKDGSVKLEHDETHDTLLATTATRDDKAKADDIDNKQCILKFDLNLFRKIGEMLPESDISQELAVEPTASTSKASQQQRKASQSSQSQSKPSKRKRSNRNADDDSDDAEEANGHTAKRSRTTKANGKGKGKRKRTEEDDISSVDSASENSEVSSAEEEEEDDTSSAASKARPSARKRLRSNR